MKLRLIGQAVLVGALSMAAVLAIGACGQGQHD